VIASTVKSLIFFQMDPLGDKVGGIQTFIRNFIRYAPDDFEMHFVGVTTDPRKRPVGVWSTLEMEGRPVRFLPVVAVRDENVKGRVPLSLRLTGGLLRHRRQIDCSDKLVTFHRIEPSVALRSHPSRTILFLHGNPLVDMKNPRAETKWSGLGWLYQSFERRQLAGIERVFIVLEEAVQEYKDRYPQWADRFQFIPTWVDDTRFFPLSPDARQIARAEFLAEQGLPQASELLMFVGRLDGHKDPLLLVDSFAALTSRRPEVALVVVGAGPLEGQVADRIRQLGLETRVRILGFVSPERVADLLRVADLFLLTSAFEGMPMSVLEALGSGVPVVAPDVGEVGRVVHDGRSGAICRLREPARVADAAVRVLAERPGPEQCAAAVRDFTASVVLDRLYREYRRLSATGSPAVTARA